MVLKFLAVAVVLFIVYLLFFKKSREGNVVKSKKDEKISDELVECPTCGTFVSQKEAILSNGKFYCSKECLLNK
jgi:uncharacterized protein